MKSKIKTLREKKGITQADLAFRCGMSLRILQKYEQGERDIRKAQSEKVVRMADVLECDVHDLFK